MPIKAIVGGVEKEITRIPVLAHDIETATGTNSVTFNTSSDRLIECDIFGNGQQNGTPAPDAPVDVQGCGEKTRNLLDNQMQAEVNFRGVEYTKNEDSSITIYGTATPSVSYCILAGDGASTNSIGDCSTPIFKSGEQVIASTGKTYPLQFRYTDGTYSGNVWSDAPVTLQKDVGLVYIQVNQNEFADITIFPMIRRTDISDSTYEPYGYKLPITCAGQTTPIYLGQVQTTRKIKKLVLTGEEKWNLINGGLTTAYLSCVDIADPAVQLQLLCTHYEAGEVYNSNTATGILVLANGGVRIRENNAASSDKSTFVSYLQHQYAAGTPVTVWYVLATPETGIINEPLMKIETYADELHSTDAAVTIPTAKGANTLTVDTTLAPSQTTVTYRGTTTAYKDAWEVRDNQDQLVWYRNDTLTGISSISFKGYGLPLKSETIKGQASQNGTPAPDAPIMPEFVGERTVNLAPPMDIWLNGYVNTSGQISEQSATRLEKTSPLIHVDDSLTYSYSYGSNSGYFPEGDEKVAWRAIACYDTDGVFLTRIGGNGRHPIITTDVNALPTSVAFIRLTLRTYGNNTNCMLNLGSTNLPYEPYGYSIPLVANSVNYPIYLGEVQSTRRIKKLVLTGQENGWYLHSINAYGIANFALQNAIDIFQWPPTNSMCSHFAPQSTIIAETKTEGILLNTEKVVFIRIYSATVSTVDGFKQWLSAQYSSGTPVTIWYVLVTPQTGIVNEPLMKIGTYADEVTVNTAIPTSVGANTFSVNTTLAPSGCSITGHIKATS